MRTVPFCHHVPPQPQPGEYGVIAFTRDIANLVTTHAGTDHRPVAVACLTSVDQITNDPARWTLLYLALADGSYAVLTKRPHPLLIVEDEWLVEVNGLPVEMHREPGQDPAELLASAIAAGLRRSPNQPHTPWT